MKAERKYDSIVIGGGPAGSTAGAVLAQHGRKVLILEKSRFPRHHIGESLMPQTFWTFQRIGMLDKLRASDFPRKESVQFVSESGKDSQPFYFTDRDPSEWSTTWQVPRDRFDRMMLDNARELGADVLENARAKRVLFEGSRAVGVDVVHNGETLNLAAEAVIDASGQNSVLSRQLGLRYGDPHLRNAAIYAYYRGARRDEGRNAGATIILNTAQRNGWFWFIPLPEDVASIGVVAPPSHLCTARGDDPLATLEEEIAGCPGMARRLEGAERISGAYVTSDFSYRSRRLAGDGWVLVGDAFGFLDPIYSSGVMLALKSGEWAADAVHEGLREGDISGERLGAFAPQFLHGMQMIRLLVHAFYNKGFSFASFTREHPQLHDHIVRILIGDVFNQEVGEVFDAMRGWMEFPEAIQLDSGVTAV
ncbi:MAG: tryptophan 7-halogenase [Phycisphaerae bacterium]|nr:tryptophan 7-halogenase [Phycisphaerae bacterium]